MHTAPAVADQYKAILHVLYTRVHEPRREQHVHTAQATAIAAADRPGIAATIQVSSTDFAWSDEREFN